MELQLRIPRSMNLYHLMADLTLSVLESIKRELDSMEVPFESYSDLENRIRRAFSPFLCSKSACGMHPVCTQEVEGPKTPASNDEIFLIQINAQFDDFLDQIAAETTQSLTISLDSETADALHRRVKAGFKRNLDPYIYYNPMCGTHDICSMSYPQNPWLAALR